MRYKMERPYKLELTIDERASLMVVLNDFLKNKKEYEESKYEDLREFYKDIEHIKEYLNY